MVWPLRIDGSGGLDQFSACCLDSNSVTVNSRALGFFVLGQFWSHFLHMLENLLRFDRNFFSRDIFTIKDQAESFLQKKFMPLMFFDDSYNILSTVNGFEKFTDSGAGEACSIDGLITLVASTGLEASAFGLLFLSPTAYGCRGIIRRLRDARCLLSLLLSASEFVTF